MITAEQATDIRSRYESLQTFLGKRRSYKTDEVAHLNPPSNDELGTLEVFEFCRDRPARYFLYIKADKFVATTFMGDTLGTVIFGREYRDNFGGDRVPVTIRAITGDTYHGTYFKSAGDYARIKKSIRK